MLFSQKEINELMKLIENFNWFFIGQTVGSKYIPQDNLKVLQSYGVKLKDLKTTYPEEAFNFGVLSIILKDSRVKDFKKLEEFKKFITSGNWIPLMEYERYALNLIERKYVEDVTALGNRIKTSVNRQIIKVDEKQRTQYIEQIRRNIKTVFENRQGVKEFVSLIGHETKDWSRDFGRIGQFILHEAFDNGRAFGLIRDNNGQIKGIKVYKKVHKGACETCHDLYMEYDRKIKLYKPKIFELEELMKNGTNVGRKKEDWKPVLGSTHPWCRCELVHVPANYNFDYKRNQFVPVRSELVNKYNLKNFFTVKITTQ